MFIIDKNGIITVNRGDSFEIPLFINQGTDLSPMRWSMKDNDSEVFLGIVEPNQSFEDALIRKKYTKDDVNEFGDIVVSITHDDTRCLAPGKYYYEVKVKFPPDSVGRFQVNTVIPRTQFFIEE